MVGIRGLGHPAASASLAGILLGGAAVAAPAPPTNYLCKGGQVVHARYPDAVTAVIRYRGRVHVLKSAVSADGVRYVGDGLQWWTTGLNRGSLSPLPAGQDYAPPGVECAAPRR